jgi:hypothetical protein
LNELSFLNKHCSNNQHQLCDGSWTGFDFQIYCKCNCHKKNNGTTERVIAPNSVETNSLEETKVNDH